MEKEIGHGRTATKLFVWAWVLGLVFYFIDYATRSAPSLMIVDLSERFSLSKQGVVSLVGSYYYTYAICALIAGICLDKLGARYAMFAGCFILGIGCILFVISSSVAGEAGRLLQGAGSAFAFPGCVYLASKGFSSKYLATAIGFTQCIGMLGGSAGQFLVQPLLDRGVSVSAFWIVSGILCIIPALLLLFLTPQQSEEEKTRSASTSYLKPFKIVFSNKDSWLSGLISGLLFVPTTVFAMTWAVPYFKLDLGFSPAEAAMTAAMASLGWVLGCPLMGMLSDRIGRRKPILLGACIGMIIVLLQMIYLPYVSNPKLSLFVFGVFSGAAMIPYSITKESNPDFVKGSATGVQNFLTFGVTSLLGPLFAAVYGNSLPNVSDKVLHYQHSLLFWVVGIALALLLTLFLKETGSKSHVD